MHQQSAQSQEVSFCHVRMHISCLIDGIKTVLLM